MAFKSGVIGTLKKKLHVICLYVIFRVVAVVVRDIIKNNNTKRTLPYNFVEYSAKNFAVHMLTCGEPTFNSVLYWHCAYKMYSNFSLLCCGNWFLSPFHTIRMSLQGEVSECTLIDEYNSPPFFHVVVSWAKNFAFWNSSSSFASVLFLLVSFIFIFFFVIRFCLNIWPNRWRVSFDFGHRCSVFAIL